LLDHTFDEPGQAVVALKQPSHHVLVYGNLELGHRISSSGCVGGYLNPFGGTVACPVCPQATSLLHSVSDATRPSSLTVKFYVTFMSSSYSRQRMVQGRTVDMSYLAQAPPPPAVEFDVNCTAAEGQKAILDMPRLTSERMSFSPGFLPPPRFLGGPPLPASRKSTSRRVFISQMSTAQAVKVARDLILGPFGI